MAKKYHGGAKRLHEVREGEMYAGYDNARKMEAKDFGMISEDRSCVANLPPDVMMKQYPRSSYGLDSNLDDTMRGIDKQIGADDSAARGHKSKSKY